ncbi:MAG: glycosyltransferase family 2 protein [Candidatus Hydrogenedentales bacterium]
MKYSVIIPTYNAAATLLPLLESLMQQPRNDIEIIVVDDASTDDTRALMQSFSAVRYERQEVNRGPAAARNAGARVAQGQWLLFTDSDTEFATGTLDALDRAIAARPFDALVGSYAGEPANEGFVPRYKALWEYCIIEQSFELDQHGMCPIQTWAPRPGLIRREVFDAVGGFNTAFVGADLEDMELGYRMARQGYQIFAAPGVHIRHHYPPTMRRELTPFARRARLWMEMAVQRREMDSHGEGSPRQAAAHMLGFGAVLLLLAGLFWPPALAVAALAGIGYLFLNGAFFVEAYRRYGVWFGLRASAYCWLHSIVLGFAAATGLVRGLWPGRRRQWAAS